MNVPTVSYSGADYQTGDTICGRWQVRSICGGRGRSGMGVVYVVDDRVRGEVLAVKTLQPQFVDNQRVRELLRREANAWLGMGSHPNIVALNFVEAFGTQIYLFMDYIAPDEQGRNSLSQFLTGEPLSLGVVAKWSIETCRALAYMREHGVEVHRDIKPDNLMIDRERGVRVTDFGLARAFSGVKDWSVGEALPNVTAVGGFVGTPGYIAPEVVAGDAPSVASDVYAFGLVMVQMLTGKSWAPFTAEWRGDVEAFERATMSVRESLHDPIVGTPFDAIVARCLEYDPAKRWTDFREIAGALAAVCERLGIDARVARQPAPGRVEAPDADRVTALYNLGRLQEALELTQQLRRADPRDARLLTCEGVIRGDLGDLAGAIPLLEQACARASGSCSNWNNLGRALRQAKRSAEALAAFERALECDAAHANVWASKGNSLHDLGRDHEALTAFDHAVSLDRYHWASQLGRAQVLDALGRFVDALAALELAFDVEPENAEARRLYALCLERLLATQAAVRPEHAAQHAARCFEEGRAEDGLRVLRETRFRQGATAELWNDESVSLRALGDARTALRCSERALRIRPEWSVAWLNKGQSLRLLGKPQDALRCYDRASELAPEDPRPWFHRHVCYRDMGLGAQARDCFREACVRAVMPLQRRELRRADEDLYYLTMAGIAYDAKDYAEAHRCAASLASSSPLYGEALQVLARSRFYLAIRFAQQDYAADAKGFVAVVRALEFAAEHLPSEAERLVVRNEIDLTLQHYVHAAERLSWTIEMPDQTPLRNLSLLCLRLCSADWALLWARYRLCESLMLEAIKRWKDGQAIWGELKRQRYPAP